MAESRLTIFRTCLIFGLSMPFFIMIPRSYRWLFSKKYEIKGRKTLQVFCKNAEYDYRESMVDAILENEAKIQNELSLATKNIFKFPIMRGIVFKLSMAWIGRV